MADTAYTTNVSPAASNGVFSSLPPIQVEYYPDTQTLHIHNGLGTSDGETVSEGLTGFYDAEGSLAGFLIWCNAETLLKPVIDAVLERRARENEEEAAAKSAAAL